MLYKRMLNLGKLLKEKSFFLFGPRSTGKSYWIQKTLSDKALIIDLLDSNYFLRFSSNPSELESVIASQKKKWIVLDEIQKIPELLNEVHRLIEKKGYHFLLTGSSARNLKKQNTNLLGGRAWKAHFFPLTWKEIPQFDLEKYLCIGGLPHVYQSKNPFEELQGYIQNYLQEEIRMEGYVRNLPPFARFLKFSALTSGQLLNFTNIGSDAQVAPSTIREYYSILEDTLIGYQLEPWTDSKKRKAIQTSKFYFFDLGVKHAMNNIRTIDRNSDLYGNSFEQFIISEVRAYTNYQRTFEDLHFWRTSSQMEVDLIIGDHTAIECKSASAIHGKHLKNLKAIAEEKSWKHLILVSQDKIEKKTDSIQCLHWETFLQKLWNGDLHG
jgi:predicted AAA+ superfamily ATPase